MQPTKAHLISSLILIFFAASLMGQNIADPSTYLDEIKKELVKPWPGNRTVNLVFHGHSVPAGYFKTPDVRTLDAYPQQVLSLIKDQYPLAVVNVIVTAIGGENSESGAQRFGRDVLVHNPDVLFIDYSLNDIGLGLTRAMLAWESMIKRALEKNISVILLTPSPNQQFNILDSSSDLQKHADQVVQLAKKYNIGLIDSYGLFQAEVRAGNPVGAYMSQVNHPNRLGHQMIAGDIMSYFRSPEVKEEFRGVWLHSGLFDKNAATGRDQIRKLFDSYREIGINNLFCYYTLKEENGFEWDYLQVLIEEGHARGIKIHPIFCPGHEVAITGEVKDHPEWLIEDRDGKRYTAMNLALPEARSYWMRRMSRVLSYDIDGIHLDYMRFPVNQRYSYDSLTCLAFKKEYGYSPKEVSQDDGSMMWCEWIGWNARQITEFIHETRQMLDKSGKKLMIGVDVFPNPATAKVLIGQDWEKWAGEGIVDFICPMLYTNDLDLFREYTARAVQLAANGCRVYPGIGVGTSHNKITKELIVREVQIAREERADGFIFFSGNSFTPEFRDALKTTVLK